MSKRSAVFLGVVGALALIVSLIALPGEPEREADGLAAAPLEIGPVSRPSIQSAEHKNSAQQAVGYQADKWAELDAKHEQMVADHLKCPVLGVPQDTRGVLQVGIERFVVEVYKPELALAQMSFYLDPGSGVLTLEGYEPFTVQWDKDGDRFLCETSTPVSAAGPFGLSGVVTDVGGSPLAAVTVRGCGGRAETEEDGSFFLMRKLNGACELSFRAPETGVTVIASAAEQDVDLGEVTLPDEPAGIGADFSLAVMAFQSGRQAKGLQVLQVLPNSPAQRVGLKPMDLVVAVNGEPTAGSHPAQFFERPVGETLGLTLQDGRELEVTMEGLRGLLEAAGQDPVLVSETLADRGIGGQY